MARPKDVLPRQDGHQIPNKQTRAAMTEARSLMVRRVSHKKATGSDKYGLAQGDFYQLHAYGQSYLDGQGDVVLIYPRTDAFDEALPVFVFPKSRGLRLWVLPFCLGERVLILPACGSLDALFVRSGQQSEGQGRTADRLAEVQEVGFGMIDLQTRQGAIARCPITLEGWPISPEYLRIVEILKHQWPLKTKHTAIRQANAALLRVTVERVFCN